ncbi:MAG: bacteriohemerythrin [Treponema sp.]|nr:bacteriohemerythrin [Treponema sp.]
MKKTMKLQVRILLFFTFFIIALSAITTTRGVMGTLDVATAIFVKEGLDYVENAVALIDGDRFEALNRSLDETDPFYERTRLELFRIWETSPFLYFFTTARGGETGFRYVIDGSGEYGSDIFSFLGDEIDPEDLDSGFFKTWETGIGHPSPLVISEWGYLISVYEPIFNSSGEVVGVVGGDFDAEFLYFVLRDQIIEKIVLGLIFALAGVLILFFLIHPVFSRLGRISSILSVLSKGGGNLSDRIKVRRKDEIGNMADLFNKTLDRICEMVILVKDQSVNLSNVGNELSENMNQTATAVSEISESIQKIKNQVSNQSDSVTQTNTTMEQVMESLDLLNKQVEDQTESVAQSSSSIEEMLANIESVTKTLIKNADNVEQLITASEIGRNSLEEVSQDILGIARESEGLLEINAVMENIASQTNLLSMNAAIEAAHAGEAGKGFAVVAGEIRKLAESSTAQSKTISEVLNKIKESIDKITKSTGVVLTKFQDIDTEVRVVSEQESNIRSAMEEQSIGSKQILEAIGRLQEITRQVKEGSAKMLEGSQQVIMEGKNLAAATREIGDGVNEIASGANYINSAVGRVRGISDNNREHISALSKEVGRFNVESTKEFVWDKTFAVGHEMIDAEHRELFAAINKLIRSCSLGQRKTFDESIDFLKNYVDKHFGDEEELQRSVEYPDYPNHKKIHDAYEDLIAQLAAKWHAAGPSEEVMKEVRAKVGDWLISHIKAQDVRLGAFIRSKKS